MEDFKMGKVFNGMAEFFCNWDSWIIIVFAVINILLWCFIKYRIKQTKALYYETSDKRFGVVPSGNLSNEDKSKLSKNRERLIVLYTGYANLTAIFPLLGILGTVSALVIYSSDTMMENFMVALETTLAGVFFAIFFKIIDSVISGQIDILVDDINNSIRESDKEKRNNNEV